MTEKKYCLGEDCPDMRCEICEATHRMIDVTDSLRTHPSISPSGYYSSGGLVHTYNPKTGKTELHYARRSVD